MAPTTRPTRSVRVLLAPETFNLGETSRCVEVAKELRRTGHEVLLVGYSRRFVDHIERAHLPFRFLSPELTNAQADQLLALDQGRGWRNPFTAEVIRERVRSELAAMADFRPDVAVIGSTASIFLSARIAGIPLVYVKPWALSRGHLNRATALPITALPPPFGTAINRVARRALTSILERSTWKPRAFRRVAADHHLHLPRRTFDAIDADLNLIASHTPLVEGWTLPENDVAVGPIYATDDSDLPPAVAELAGWDRPLVYVGLGSSANRPLALRLSSRSRRPMWRW